MNEHASKFQNTFSKKSQIKRHRIHLLGSLANTALQAESVKLPSSWIVRTLIQDIIHTTSDTASAAYSFILHRSCQCIFQFYAKFSQCTVIILKGNKYYLKKNLCFMRCKLSEFKETFIKDKMNERPITIIQYIKNSRFATWQFECFPPNDEKRLTHAPKSRIGELNSTYIQSNMVG